MLKRHAIALAAASLLAFGANAQESSGGIMGNATAGDTVEVVSQEIGVRREVTVPENGKYQFRRLPLGTYVVTVKHADGSTESPKAVLVRAGTTMRIK